MTVLSPTQIKLMKKHPDFDMLRKIRRRLDEQCMPIEGRKAKVTKDFYTLVAGQNILGFELSTQEPPVKIQQLKYLAGQPSLVFQHLFTHSYADVETKESI
jgi:hypothetical protein